MSQQAGSAGLDSTASTRARDVIANDVATEVDTGRPGKTQTGTGSPAPVGAVAVRNTTNVLIVAGAIALVVIVIVAVVVVRLTTSQTTTTEPRSATQVVITDNEDVFVGNASPCLGPVTLRLKWAFANVPAGAVVVVDLSGPGLPPQITFTLASDRTFEQDYQIRGAGAWMTKIVSIANKPPPALHSTNAATATCG